MNISDSDKTICNSPSMAPVMSEKREWVGSFGNEGDPVESCPDESRMAQRADASRKGLNADASLEELNVGDNPTEGIKVEKMFRLRKAEKLRHKSLVDALFKEGHTIYEFPLRLTWRALTEATLDGSFRDRIPEHIGPVQMLVTVPKKKRKHAVDRVLMRRRIREAYRLNRLPIKQIVDGDDSMRTLGLAFVYIHDKNLPYSTVETKMRSVLRKLSEKLKRRLEIE